MPTALPPIGSSSDVNSRKDDLEANSAIANLADKGPTPLRAIYPNSIRTIVFCKRAQSS